MKKDFHVTLLTPFGQYLSTDVDYLSVKTGKGVVGILPNHAPLITTIEISKLTIKKGDQELKYAVSGGLMHIKEGTDVVIMVNAIESKDEIDINRARDAQRRAEEKLSGENKIDTARARAALMRALNRISIYEE